MKVENITIIIIYSKCHIKLYLTSLKKNIYHLILIKAILKEKNVIKEC